MDKLINLDDDRLGIFFRPTPETEATASTADDEYVGLPNGLDDVSALTYNGGPEFQSRIGALFFERADTEAGLKIAKGVIMTYPELQFILAEAREKGMITTSTAEAYYLEGVESSFEFYGVDRRGCILHPTGCSLYRNNRRENLRKSALRNGLLFTFQDSEAWFDWRRTGLPELLPAVDNQNGDKIPVRFIYPIIEQSLNGANRAAAVTRQGADDLNSRVWWDISEN